ncbi:MAG: hypothetical protein JSV34_03060 [Candidatus Omnitrophota bacterium]|nr:MAG: hypothetical protein JSV34_03060 [Candidatus Omnitrophota bacterium]
MKTAVTILMLILCLALSGVCFAADGDSSQGIDVKSTVPDIFKLDIWVRAITDVESAPTDPEDLDPYDDDYAEAWGEKNAPPDLDFGEFEYKEISDVAEVNGKMRDVVYGIYQPKRFFCVFLSAKTQGRKYKLTQECVADDEISETLLLVTDYRSEDLIGKFPQGGKNGATVIDEKEKQFADQNGPIDIFTSNAIGETRIVRCWYRFAEGAEDEPENVKLLANVPTGSYSGSVTYTLVEN